VWNLPSALTDHRSKSRALAISPLLNGYDVVILNEAFVNARALLSATSHAHTYAPPRPPLSPLNSGLLFLSKHAVVARGWERFRAVAALTADVFAAKGIGYVTVEVERAGARYGRVQLFGTHMQAAASAGAQAARMAQAEQAASFVARARDGAARLVVLAGDLNMGPRQHTEFDVFSCHYEHGRDARARCEAYERLLGGCGLREVRCEAADYAADICRFLVDGAGDEVLRYVEMGELDGRALSDTRPMCLTVTLEEVSGRTDADGE
jgi:hypothetical protein